MSRRKQPNPNKVKLMENSTEDMRTKSANCTPAGEEEAEQSEDRQSPALTETHTEGLATMEKEEHEWENGADGVMEGADGVDLSSINSMMSTVMKAAQLNGAVDSAHTTPVKVHVKSPGTNRSGRKIQEAKDDGGCIICPLCDKSFQTQHQLTMHIRQHNTDSGTADHSCSICGKSLSSASSLDRHMLVHSGERPYKCNLCGQTFTTNGNMHRHMKIHEKDSASSIPNSPTLSPPKRRRPSAAKRKLSQDDDSERSDEPSAKKALEDSGTDEQGINRGQEEVLTCPICFKALSSRNDLDAHMEIHPDTTLRCDLCCMSFRTHRSLLRHNAATHKKLPTDPNGRPFIQNNPSIPLGFNDLAFIDFSCHKFPHIAQVWCETNLRRCTGKFHRFVCDKCDKAFPLCSALDLHKTSHETSSDTQETASPVVIKDETPEKSNFMDSLGLQHISQVKPAPSEEDALQAKLDSIRVIHVDPNQSTVPQEPGLIGAVSLSLVDPSTLHGLSHQEALKLLSLQPFQTSFLMQPDGGVVVKPVCGESNMELADIQQILKVASAAPNQIALPPLSKAPCSAVQTGYKQMPPLKPKPLVAPRTGMLASTPPPLLNTQQASLGCISPSLPPPANHPLKNAREVSSPSSSSSSNHASTERIQMEAECMGDAHTPMDTDERHIKQEIGKLEENTDKKGNQKGSYPCRFCDQVFPFSSALQAHMRYHLGILPHQCNICDYVAPDKATLIRHLRTHSGERPYVCRLCHYPFTVKANCERHLRKKHMKSNRKEIEKNIKYVTSSTSTADLLEQAGATETTCRFCGEDLKSFRDLQIHLRTHNGCQRKPFECKRCGAAFLAKRNCIHHLLKQHLEVQEQDIEEHIITLVPVSTQNNANPSNLNGVSASALVQSIKIEDISLYSADMDQPLDFSKKIHGASSAGNVSGIKIEPVSYDSSMEPIDLSIPKNPVKKFKQDIDAAVSREVKKEQSSISILAQALQADRPVDEKSQQLGCYQLPVALTSLTGNANATGRPLRLKPLLPKPSSAAVKELPPLASIAQIISSVSGAPDLLKRENTNNLQVNFDTTGKQESPDTFTEELPINSSKKKSRKRHSNSTMKEKPAMNATDQSIDLESSGEFASVERMLANTDANKFSAYLQTNTIELARKGGQPSGGDGKEVKDEKHSPVQQNAQPQQSKGKKNAYSNSVQKMTCPFCPRVFPWASSLQRHMLTHTGQKPYPCPQCDAFFSTKSNCERHLLRKHGVSNRLLRRNGVMQKPKETEEGSPESAESTSETELPMSEAMDLTSSDHEKPVASDAEKPSPAKPTEAALTEMFPHEETEEPEALEPLKHNEPEKENDSPHIKTLNLTFTSKPADFKFAENDQPQSSPAVEGEVSDKATPQEDSKFTCKSCNKSFRYAATLTRHEKVHQLDLASDMTNGPLKADDPAVPCETKKEVAEETAEKCSKKSTADMEGTGSVVESGSEEEKEERSDEEGATTEPKSVEGEEPGSKPDKRKKVCNICSKRFWSLQDLTRHMRSHTGERPYKCQTCERTFTLKHSLVRHQRIHQKSRRADGGGSMCGVAVGADEEGFSGRSASESECTPTSTNPPSENECDVTETVKGKDRGEDCAPSLPTEKVAGKKEFTPAVPHEETGASPAQETAEEQASDSPVTSETEPPFIKGVLEIHTKPTTEHILSPSEVPLLGVE